MLLGFWDFTKLSSFVIFQVWKEYFLSKIYLLQDHGGDKRYIGGICSFIDNAENVDCEHGCTSTQVAERSGRPKSAPTEEVALYESNPKGFLRRVVTVESSIIYCKPETKQQSEQWTGQGEATLERVKIVPIAGKVMATFPTRFGPFPNLKKDGDK